MLLTLGFLGMSNDAENARQTECYQYRIDFWCENLHKITQKGVLGAQLGTLIRAN
jgi:hypothetical protein